MQAFLKYPGGKSKELPIINKYKPKKICRYFEPFLGSGAVYLDMKIDESYINDKSSDLYYLFKYVKDNNQKFKNKLISINNLWKRIGKLDINSVFDKTIFKYSDYKKYFKKSLSTKLNAISKMENSGSKISLKDRNAILLTAKKTAIYMLVRDMYNRKTTDKETKIACFFFLREYCYSSMFRFSYNGNFNVPYGGKSYNKKNLDNKISYMFSDALNKYFKNTKIYNLDFENFMNKFSFNKSDFIFLDPPYDTEFSTYDKNLFGKNEQVRLSKYLKKVKAKWMLVIKKTDFICNLYKKYHCHEYAKKYVVSFKNRNNQRTTHLLITNY